MESCSYKMNVDNLEKLELRTYLDVLRENSLLEEEFLLSELTNSKVEYISYNSQDVREGTLFVCKGNNFQVKYLEQAIKSGAIAYVSEVDYSEELSFEYKGIPLIKVNNIRRAMAHVAMHFFRNPQDSLKFIGVTGTKGKTTTASIINESLMAANKAAGKPRPAFVSSIYYYFGEEEQGADLTTPETFELYYILYKARENGLNTVVMEVSSQALKYDRAYGINYEYGLFLNIAPDHISPVEHPDFEDYLESKLLLLDRSDISILNLQTEYLDRVKEAAEGTRIISADIDNKDADYTIDEFNAHTDGIDFKSNKNFPDIDFTSSVHGTYNLQNIALAMAVLDDMDIDMKYLQEGINNVDLSSRTTIVENEDKSVLFYIDAAHNGLSFEAVFESAKESYPDYKLVVVFGSVGNKAENRREEMAKASNGNVSHVYVTRDDNDREDLAIINQDIISFLDEELAYTNTTEREEAFRLAYQDALKEYEETGTKTAVLALGKGAELYMKIDGIFHDYIGDKALIEAIIEEENR